MIFTRIQRQPNQISRIFILNKYDSIIMTTTKISLKLGKLILTITLIILTNLMNVHGIAQKKQKDPYFSTPPFRYSCDYDPLDITQWFKSKTRTLDEEGIILNNLQYHPLGITHFGMICYNHFVETKDSTYYRHFVNQIKYFKDTSLVDLSHNGERMGLPYQFPFHDLKAPWYSGMTQGWAIVFMFRYYYHSHDPEALQIIQKMAQFMIQPVSQNGTIGRTPEGYPWIEEYPNTKVKPQVLNGYINGLLGLKEYVDYFKSDTLAKRIHDETYQALKNTLTQYDTPTWTSYDRKKGKISNGYLQYEIFEMQDLYSVYKDEQFLDQMKIWCYMGYKKYHNEKNPQFRFLTFDLSEKLHQGKNNSLYARIIKENFLGSNNPLSESTIDAITPITLTFDEKEKVISFDVLKNSEVNSGYFLLDSSYTRKFIEIELIDSLNHTQKIKAYRSDYVGQNLFKFSFDKTTKLKKLVIKIKQLSGAEQVTIVDAALFLTSKYSIPFYAFYASPTLQFNKETHQLKTGKLTNGEQLTVFYRQAGSKVQLAKTKWTTFNKFDLTNETIDVQKWNYYELLIVYKPTFNLSHFEGFKLE